jgi:hypothetical protein
MSYFDKYIPGNVALFNQELNKIAEILGTNPEWHKAVMYLESGFDPGAYNPDGGASGLIQFYPDVKNGNFKTLAGKKVDLTLIRSMSAVNQLPYVYMYYSAYKNRMKSIYDLYMVNFIPAGLNKPDNFLLDFPKYHLPAASIAKANPAIDLNRDGQIYVYEFKNYIRKKIPAAVLEEIEKKK